MAKQALILIDIQNDYFPQGKWPLDGVEAAADKAAQVLQAFRQCWDAVIHVRHEFTSEDAPFFTPGSEGAHLHPKVLNEGSEPVVLKHFVNSFRETHLRALLEQRSITELVVVGSMSHMCIDAVVRAAADLEPAASPVDARVVAPLAASPAAASPQKRSHEQNLGCARAKRPAATSRTRPGRTAAPWRAPLAGGAGPAARRPRSRSADDARRNFG
mgnify:CR=1 FL=1